MEKTGANYRRKPAVSMLNQGCFIKIIYRFIVHFTVITASPLPLLYNLS